MTEIVRTFIRKYCHKVWIGHQYSMATDIGINALLVSQDVRRACLFDLREWYVTIHNGPCLKTIEPYADTLEQLDQELLQPLNLTFVTCNHRRFFWEHMHFHRQIR